MPNQSVRLRIEPFEDRTVPAVTTAFDDTTGRLVVASDAADRIVIGSVGPDVAVNGLRLTVAAGAVQTLHVNGGPGPNVINLAGVRATAFTSLTAVAVDGGAGADTITGSAFADDINGGPDGDRVSGSGGNDTLAGGDGDDRLSGKGGDDRLLGDAGADTLDGNGGADSLDGGADNDTLRGGGRNDTLAGGPGNDSMMAAAGDDRLDGGGGADTLNGGPGNDVVESGDPVATNVVFSGFNDAAGVNADTTPNSPYALNANLVGNGAGEPGWAQLWQQPVGSFNHPRVQTAVAYEGDGALRISGGTSGIERAWSAAETTGVVSVAQMVRVPAGGGGMTYVQDGNIPTGAEKTAAMWRALSGQNYEVLDSGIWEDTGIPVPVDQWDRLETRIDMTARTYDFFVNGVQYVPPDPIGFRGNPVALNVVSYLIETAVGIYIDALEVTLPVPGGQPATAGDTLIGGGGNDTVRGGSAGDLVIGMGGNDQLDGGGGRDLMVGGRGADALVGGDGEDLLVAGPTVYDKHKTALPSIAAEWTSARTLAERFANVTGTGTGPRLNGNYFLKRGRVSADAARDTLTGAAGLDGLIFRTTEDNSDLAADEFFLPI
jgi:Ca2+-binding RTX toxin-like protein